MSSANTDVGPNERLLDVLEPTEGGPASEEEVEAFWQTIERGPTAEDYGDDPDDHDPLTWDTVPLIKDEGRLRKLARYFDGIDPEEDPEVIRDRLRTVDVEDYTRALILVNELEREG